MRIPRFGQPMQRHPDIHSFLLAVKSPHGYHVSVPCNALLREIIMFRLLLCSLTLLALAGPTVRALPSDDPSKAKEDETVRRRNRENRLFMTLLFLERDDDRQEGGRNRVVILRLVLEAAKDKDEGVRAEAVDVLGQLGGSRFGEPIPPEVMAALAEALRDSKEAVRLNAARSLYHLSDKAAEATPALAAALKDSSPSVRREVANTLRWIGPAAKDAIPALRAALQDDDVEGRINAAAALWKVSGQAEDASPILSAALKEKDVRLRRVAAWALVDMGPAGRVAAPG
jgi:hypothetical protein